eukprot:1219717-Amphidinium_carterae.2
MCTSEIQGRMYSSALHRTSLIIRRNERLHRVERMSVTWRSRDFVLVQVIPDVKLAPQKSAQSSRREDVECQLADMLDGDEEAPREDKVRLAANYYVLKALDHCLQVSFKKGLATFIPGKILRPLNKTEKRYLLAQHQCPDKCVLGQDHRMCVYDSEAKKSRYEISPEAPPCIHIIADQGPMGWPGLHFMSDHLQVCSTYRWDESHRMWNDTKLSVSKSGLDMIRIAATVIYNTACGPYGSGAWQNEISWAAGEMTRIGGPNHALFLLHFDEIAKECHSQETWGTEAHQEDVWRLVCESKALWKQGAHVKYSRWFSFLQRSEEMLSTWHSLLLVLTWLGVERKWWRRREEFPLWNPSDALDVYSSLGNIEEAQEENPGEVVENGLQELRRKTSNQLHMTARLLANPMLKSLVAVMCVVSRPVSIGHARMVEEFKSSAGSLAYWVWCAAGAWEQDMREILGSLRNEGHLREMGFKLGPQAQRISPNRLLEGAATVVGGPQVLGVAHGG